MKDRRVHKIFIIIVCFACTAAVLIYGSVEKKDKDTPGIIKDFILNNEKNSTPTLTPEVNFEISDNVSDTEIETSDKPVNDQVALEIFDNVKNTLSNDNNVSDSDNNGIKEPTFYLLYADKLYEKKVPDEVFLSLTDEIQKYINETYITDAEEISRVAILETSIEMDEDNNKVSFGIRLDKGSTADYVYIDIDLITMEYIFREVKL